MSTIEKLPKWVSLLLTLLIGTVFTFGGQLFVTMAAGGQQQAVVNAPPNCTLEDGAPQAGKTTKFALGKLGQSNDDKSIQNIDVTQFHLACGNGGNNNGKNNKNAKPNGKNNKNAKPKKPKKVSAGQ